MHNVKDAHRSGRITMENIDIFQKIEENHHVSNYNITKELNIDYKI